MLATSGSDAASAHMNTTCGSALMAAGAGGGGGAGGGLGGGRGLQLALQWRRRGDDDDDDAVDDAAAAADDDAVAVAAVGLALPADGRDDSGPLRMLWVRHSWTYTM